ncbi:glycoside hydrolase family 7 protein [Athelia psychrophila]|uniref:Glucanase n=1 Tax=Athelia psychrophila TaxID=1759441 RepID=A0A166SDN9_9AGAM|nr:glycoside hydrolase family 7 protein [Fibularhizoctonia sp. CBS 109695]
MFPTAALISFSLLAVVHAQQIGTQLAEVHPALSFETCTASGCTTNAGQVTMDANWRWTHTTTGYTNCYTGNEWDATICPDGVTCAANCALDGADYSGTYGVTTSGASLKLDFVTTSTQTNVGSRLYLMSSNTEYEIFKPLNQEFSFDVDVSELPCGLNGAVYFSEMSADGGLAAYPTNKAGAEYGTGYCDSQCPRDIKFINGVANVVGWNATSANSGNGNFGSCCNEMDIWEANSVSAAFTPHPCTVVGQTECTGTACATTDRYGSACDPDGCDFNSYRQGDTSFYGPGKTVDTTKPFTVVTQFHTSDNTSTGTLTEIKRLYVQNGVVIQNSQSTIAGVTGNSITTAYCDAQKTVFGDTNDFDTKGGLATMGKSLGRGAVLVLSVWDDYAVNMLWLDSDYPTTADPSTPGVARGTCATTSGVPAQVEVSAKSASVTYSNIKIGSIGSTYASGTTQAAPPAKPARPP